MHHEVELQVCACRCSYPESHKKARWDSLANLIFLSWKILLIKDSGTMETSELNEEVTLIQLAFHTGISGATSNTNNGI